MMLTALCLLLMLWSARGSGIAGEKQQHKYSSSCNGAVHASHQRRSLNKTCVSVCPFNFTESREDNSVYDLFELAKVNKKHNGVSLVKGPDPYSPAYKILNPNLIPAIPERSFRDLIYSIQEEKGFLFVANLKQAKKTRGSLFSVERSDGSGSIFELVSNGISNTLDLIYVTASGHHEISIDDARLASGSWENITLFVQEDRAQLYIGCEEINTSELDAPIHQILTQDVADVSVLRIGKGAVKSRFMVSASEAYIPEVFSTNKVPSNAWEG